ncbi:hypothetical protein [Actinoplanes sp. HUAS TT8]|uniref:hypothetical protein n=1 Tax=Actinoplanes sp. HUAS TT8 TaxID=3447453 RepID=UPI003F520723
MGIDLELADCAAAKERLAACEAAGPLCPHEPDCEAKVYRSLARAADDRPGEVSPSEFRYRHFADINQNMRLLGMGYAAEPEDSGDEPEPEFAGLGWRTDTPRGRRGIAAFKLESNDRWFVSRREIDEALTAYAEAPAETRATLETDEKWASWIRWLTVARDHGGFEAE